MDANCIYAFAGQRKSGKTTFARQLAHKLGLRFASFGEYVRKEAARRGLENPTIAQLQAVGSSLVAGDLAAFCKSVLTDAGFVQGEGLVIDGVRHVEVLAMIKTLARTQIVKLIYVESSTKDRLGRSSLNARELREIDSHPMERDALKLKSAADLVLDTSKDEATSFRALLQWAVQK